MSMILDTRGPVVNTDMSVVVGKDGVEAPGYRYTPPGDKPDPWQGQWIAPANRAGEAFLLRREITLETSPAHVQVWVTATTQYQIYLNGILAARGPADSGRDYIGETSRHWFYDCRNLTPLLHRGRNIIAVQMLGSGSSFLFEARAHMAGGQTLTVTSDETWRGIAADYLKKLDGGWHYDGAKEPAYWQSVDFDDSAWSACTLAAGTDDTLVASILPPCMEAQYPMHDIAQITGGIHVPTKPLQEGRNIIVTSDGSFAVHFDRILSARMGIKIKGGEGTVVALQAHEISNHGDNGRISMTLRDGVQTFESPGYFSVGVINVTLSHVTSPVEILDISADFTSQPLTYQGTFVCSDDTLNAIWKACRWATQICLQTHHLDSPHHQEPISDYGDYLIEDRVSFAAFGDSPWIMKQDLRKWAWVMKNSHYRIFHTSYALLWLQSLTQYYDYTGDLETVLELAPFAHELLEQFETYVGKNGILSEAPNYMFMDWVEMHGIECHHPPAVIGQGYLTGFYYRALADGERVASLTGDSARGKKYAHLRRGIAEAYNRELWDDATGLYRDGKPFVTSIKPSQWLPVDTDIETWSAQSNVLAVLYDLAPKSRQQAIINLVMAQTFRNVRPYYMQFVLDAIAHVGLFDRYGTQCLREWHIVPETQTFYEMGDGGDLSHGWVATPLCQMSEQILGIRPLEPGFATVSIRPTLCDLAWAAGSVPTPHGAVAVSWERKGNDLTLRLIVPQATQAHVVFPAMSAQAELTVNGEMVWKKGPILTQFAGANQVTKSHSALEMSVPSGSYIFAGHNLGLPATSKDEAIKDIPFAARS